MAKFTFTDRYVSIHNENGQRTATPEETFNRYNRHISPITGIVSAIYPSVWNEKGPLKSYTAGHNFALKNDSLFFLKDGLRTNSSGKGKTDTQARTSALCEALERYSGLFLGEEPRKLASFVEIFAEAIDPRTVMLFSAKKYEYRQSINERGERFQFVPLKFDEHAIIEWSPVYSYTQKRTKYLPTSYLYFGYPNPEDKLFCWADSNGNAAGSCLEDA